MAAFPGVLLGVGISVAGVCIVLDCCLSTFAQQRSLYSKKMGDAAGRGAILAGLKNKMSTLKDELDNLQDAYDQKCKECETLKEERDQVSVSYSYNTYMTATTCYSFLRV